MFPALINTAEKQLTKKTFDLFLVEVNSVYFNCRSRRAEMQFCAAESFISGSRAGPDKARRVVEHKERQQREKVLEERKGKRLAVRERCDVNCSSS